MFYLMFVQIIFSGHLLGRAAYSVDRMFFLELCIFVILYFFPLLVLREEFF